MTGAGPHHRRAAALARAAGSVDAAALSRRPWTEEERRRHPYLKEDREVLPLRRAASVLYECVGLGLLRDAGDGTFVPPVPA